MPEERKRMCIECGELLAVEEVNDSSYLVRIPLSYCGNHECLRYGLYVTRFANEIEENLNVIPVPTG